MNKRLRNAFSLILLLQFLVVVVGTLSTSAILKVYGYPDAVIMKWNPISVFVRDWGWIGIIVPCVIYWGFYRYVS